MESGSRKKRTLAERRESDKLRQRRFREKKREKLRMQQAELLRNSCGSVVVEKEKKEKIPTAPRRTAEQIRETNRIRQQRFRAKKRADQMESGEDQPMEMELDAVTSQSELLADPTDPVEILKQFLTQAVNEEKDRQTELRREKDRMRKRRDRQKRKETGDIQTIGELAKMITTTCPKEELNDVEKEEEEDVETTEEPVTEQMSQLEFMSQLEKMGIVLKPSTETSTPEEPCSSSNSPSPIFSGLDLITPEKKPWQRCNTSEERRERERMRKRMYRARQKYITTGKLEMQWDPTPIKRVPDDEEGITPLPEWSTTLTAEQKTEAHRIYNKRYRERIKSSAVQKEIIQTDLVNSEVSADNEIPSYPPEMYNELLSIIAKCDLTSLVSQNS